MFTTHQHTYAMCVHRFEWHAACVKSDCPDDHFAFESLHPIRCDFCGSLNHAPINCPEASAIPRWLRNPERVGKDLSSYIPPQRHPF